jgi:hypothetical protein
MVVETASIVAGGSQYYADRLTEHIRVTLQISIGFNGP